MLFDKKVCFFSSLDREKKKEKKFSLEMMCIKRLMYLFLQV